MAAAAVPRTASIDPREVSWLRRRARAWFDLHGRSFPWRRSRDPYAILIAELLLQRTRADLVAPLFGKFMASYPDPRALAAADPAELLELLRPLGFLHRSERLPQLGRTLVEQFGGSVPPDESELRSLPGVGRYIANAVLLLAFGRSRPLLDPNVLRLLDRCFDVRSTRARPREDADMWVLLQRATPMRNPRPVALGLIDLGATVCLPRRPRCGLCPLRGRCTAYRNGRVNPAA